jgi:hypothetical protein
VKQDGAELQRRVVRDAKPPVGRDGRLRGIVEITFDDGQEIGHLLPAAPVSTKPAVVSPLLQAHARLRSRTGAAPPGPS